MSNNQDKLSVTYPSYDAIRGKLVARLLIIVAIVLAILIMFMRTPPKDKYDPKISIEGKTMEELDRELRRK